MAVGLIVPYKTIPKVYLDGDRVRGSRADGSITNFKPGPGEGARDTALTRRNALPPGLPAGFQKASFFGQEHGRMETPCSGTEISRRISILRSERRLQTPGEWFHDIGWVMLRVLGLSPITDISQGTPFLSAPRQAKLTACKCSIFDR